MESITQTQCITIPKMEEEPFKTDTFLTKVKNFFMGDSKKDGKVCKPAITYTSIVILTLLFIGSSFACGIMWFTDIYFTSILEQMTIKEGSDIFEAWRAPPIKPLICARVFNYTNVERFAAKKDPKLKVVEVGPYCYRETLLKTNVVFNKNGTVTYSDRRTHKFEPENSNGNQDDWLIVPNVVLISAVSKTKDLPGWIRLSSNIFLPAVSSATIRVKAHDFFFGYNDNLFQLYSTFSKFIQKDVPVKQFGMLALRATETKDTITVRTGSNDLERIGIVTAMNGQSEMSAWPDEACNRIDGSDGAFFPRHLINTSNTLYLFHKDLCRKLPLVYQEDEEFQDGVMAMRYHVPSNVYDTEGTCYCWDDCPPRGVFDVSPCAEGAPLMTSFPHFMNGDPSLTKYIDGLHPDPKKHDFYVLIQPILGFTLGTVSRIQINVQIRKSEDDNIIEEFPNNMILPVFWLEVTADRLPDDLYRMIYHSSVTVNIVQKVLRWVTLISTVFTGGLLMYLIWRKCQEHNNEKSSKERPQNKRVLIMRLTTV